MKEIKGYRTLMIISVVICPLSQAFTSVLSCQNCKHKIAVQDHQVLCSQGKTSGGTDDEN